MKHRVHRERVEVVGQIGVGRSLGRFQIDLDGVATKDARFAQQLEVRAVLEAELFGSPVDLQRGELRAFAFVGTPDLTVRCMLYWLAAAGHRMHGPVVAAQSFARADLDIACLGRQDRR